MGTYVDDGLIDDYMDTIEILSVLGLFGEDVENRIAMVVSEACYYLSHSLQGNGKNNVLFFKRRLKKMADLTHSCLPDYTKTLEYAIALIDLDQAAYHPKNMQNTRAEISNSVKNKLHGTCVFLRCALEIFKRRYLHLNAIGLMR